MVMNRQDAKAAKKTFGTAKAQGHQDEWVNNEFGFSF